MNRTTKPQIGQMYETWSHTESRPAKSKSEESRGDFRNNFVKANKKNKK